jgi:hypothetical protein
MPSGSASDYKTALHLEDAYFLGLEYFDSSPDIYLQPGNEVRKQLIYEHGAISAGMFSSAGIATWGKDSQYYNGENHAWYYNGDKKTPDHSVLIAGWDDNYPRTNFKSGNRPSRDGAWLIKNSWGNNFGDGGYFWLSYETISFTDGVVFLAGEADNYDKNYGCDDLGWCASGHISSGSSAWISNVFSTTGSETLEAVAFYTTSGNAAYDIYIYTGLRDLAKDPNPAGGTLAVKFSGAQDFAGYHTVKLPKPLHLRSDSKFSVAINMKTPGYDYPIAIEANVNGYSDEAVIESGVSFVSLDGASWRDAALDGANICIRAFTSNGGDDDDEGDAGATTGRGSGGGCATGSFPAYGIFAAAIIYTAARKKR